MIIVFLILSINIKIYYKDANLIKYFKNIFKIQKYKIPKISYYNKNSMISHKYQMTLKFYFKVLIKNQSINI